MIESKDKTIEVGNWGYIDVCSGCGSQVSSGDIYDRRTCWNCGAVGKHVLPNARVSRRFITTEYRGFWPFKKAFGHYEYGKVADHLRSTGKFPLSTRVLTNPSMALAAGFATGMF